MKQILKQFFVIIITFVLVFAISIPCLASDNTHGGGGASGGYRDWSQSEKEDYWRYRAQKYFARLAGVDEEVVAKRWLDKLQKVYGTEGCASLEEYLVKEVSYDEDTDCFVPSENLTVVVNNLLQEENDTVTMVYRYPLNKANIDGSNFPSMNFLNAFTALLDAFPDCYFYASDDLTGNYDAQNLDTGATSAQVWPNHYIFWVVEKPVSGVNAYPDLMTTPISLYDDNWNRCKAACVAICSSDNYETADNITYFSVNNIYYYNAYRRYDGNMYSSLSDLKLTYFANSADVNMCNQFSWKRTLTDLKTPYSASKNPINVYKTVADMKKDIGSQVIGGYTPEYTGKCAPSVSVEVINNIGTDDSGGGSGSGGGSSGSDDSGGGSNILDGLGKVFGAVGKLIDTIFGFILDIFSKLIDNVTKILDMFVGALKKLVDLVPSGFNEFLAALFPYIPEEWKTIIEAMLLVSVLGVVVAVFRR